MLTFENAFLELNLNLLGEEVCTWQHEVFQMYQFKWDMDTFLLIHNFFSYNKNFKLVAIFNCAIYINLASEANV